MTPEVHFLLEAALRIGSVLFFLAGSFYIGKQLFLEKLLRPRPIWLYVFAVSVGVSIWRLILLAGLAIDLPQDIAAEINLWAQPIREMFYSQIGIGILSLAYANSRRRRDDEDG